MNAPPLILTLTLDHVSQHFFDEKRRSHFPPERNYLDAHLTLFHHLPPGQPQVINDIQMAADTYRQMKLNITGLKMTGSGVAYVIECPLLLQLHAYLQKLWWDKLIPQDKHKLWPHITVQNKVPSETATLLKADLEQRFEPFTGTGVGLSLFEYLGGPWKPVQQWQFNER